MKKLFAMIRGLCACCVFVLIAGAGSPAAAATLTFDDVPADMYLADVPGGYGGLSWNFWQVASPPGYSQGATHSGFGESSVSHPVESAPGSCCVPALFNFIGADFARGEFGQNPQHEAGYMFLRGWLAGAELYAVLAPLAVTGYTNVAVNFLGIDMLTVQPIHATSFGFGYPGFFMDNFSYSLPEDVDAPVPEPATLLLVGAGALASFRSARRARERQGARRCLVG